MVWASTVSLSAGWFADRGAVVGFLLVSCLTATVLATASALIEAHTRGRSRRRDTSDQDPPSPFVASHYKHRVGQETPGRADTNYARQREALDDGRCTSWGDGTSAEDWIEIGALAG